MLHFNETSSSNGGATKSLANRLALKPQYWRSHKRSTKLLTVSGVFSLNSYLADIWGSRPCTLEWCYPPQAAGTELLPWRAVSDTQSMWNSGRGTLCPALYGQNPAGIYPRRNHRISGRNICKRKSEIKTVWVRIFKFFMPHWQNTDFLTKKYYNISAWMNTWLTCWKTKKSAWVVWKCKYQNHDFDSNENKQNYIFFSLQIWLNITSYHANFLISHYTLMLNEPWKMQMNLSCFILHFEIVSTPSFVFTSIVLEVNAKVWTIYLFVFIQFLSSLAHWINHWPQQNIWFKLYKE